MIEDKTIIKATRDWIMKCPYFYELRDIGVDFLSEDINSNSIEKVPTKPILQEYVDGSSKRQFTFILASRFIFSEETKNQIENSGFYEKVSDWVEEKSKSGILPVLGKRKKALEVEVLSSDYLYNISDNMRSARYQIQIRLIYKKEPVEGYW